MIFRFHVNFQGCKLSWPCLVVINLGLDIEVTSTIRLVFGVNETNLVDAKNEIFSGITNNRNGNSYIIFTGAQFRI